MRWNGRGASPLIPEYAGYLSLVPIFIGIGVGLILAFYLATPTELAQNLSHQYVPLYHQAVLVFAESFQIDFSCCIRSLRQLWVLKLICGIALLVFGMIIWKLERTFTPLFAMRIALGYAFGFTSTPLPSYSHNDTTLQNTT